MARLLQLDTFSSDSGDLTVIEKILPGAIRRVYYVHEIREEQRVGRRHRQAWHVLVCLNGSCRIYCHDGIRERWYGLEKPQTCLVLEPRDWYFLDELAPGAILLVLSNEPSTPDDAVYAPYPAVS
ncbi:FdtA/QdtA family cupin domain-containing protein [Larkinella ripae]